MSQRAYCTVHNIAYHVFHYWYGLYRSNHSDSGKLLPVRIQPSGSMDQTIVIKGNHGYEIHLPMQESMIPFILQLLQG